MLRAAVHARIPVFPYAASLQGAWLENLREEANGKRHDLLLEYQEFSPILPPKILMREGTVYERIRGRYIPRRLRFPDIEALQIDGVYKDLSQAGPDHPAREVHDLLHWIPKGARRIFYVLFNSSKDHDELRFYARGVVEEKRPGRTSSVSLERDWSCAPPTRPGIVPSPTRLYERFGGDPISIHLDSKPYHRRLFIGGVDVQPRERPAVASVLNVGEYPSLWTIDNDLPACDRWANKGEGHRGMSLDEICHEAEWVIGCLKKGQRVLVHCAAGMNRSSTICCAVLILLEGLSAEQALERVREHHPWARPDSQHWLKLRWLAMNRLEIANRTPPS